MLDWFCKSQRWNTELRQGLAGQRSHQTLLAITEKCPKESVWALIHVLQAEVDTLNVEGFIVESTTRVLPASSWIREIHC